MIKRQLNTVLLVALLFGAFIVKAQDTEKNTISAIYQNALTNYDSYNNLRELCTKAPGRLVGSPASELAIQILKAQVGKLQPDTCYLQNYTTPSWRVKSPCRATVQYGSKTESLNVVNLGLSVSTPLTGITGEILEVHSLNAVDSLGSKVVKDKIVFFNRAMDNSKTNTFEAYSGGVDQRAGGAAKAAQYGASGAIVRSLSTEKYDFPHTGVSRYKEGITKIPNISISTNDAEMLSRLNKQHAGVKVWVKSDTETIDSARTSNLIAEIKGSKHPEKIILIGAHMDAWFNSPGAHDDGAGCEQMIDVFRIFKELNIKPENTIRLVLFMDEEMYQSGSKVYAASVGKEKREHIVSIESDAGGLLPLGFGIDAGDSVINSLKKLAEPLVDYGIYKTGKGYGGVDIAPLKSFGIPLVGLMTNSQRYFEYHHSANDTVENVSRREMQLGTAAIASLVYLIDKNGIKY
ncbi:MAG: M20/M25/M40 family metallo-hydrolase [Paludibacter sp.]|nr:M20/M25/M40 family metallo-hydrolase [Paludibacter sp.]